MRLCYNDPMKIDLALDIGGTHMRGAVFSINKDKPERQKRIRTYTDGENSLDRLLDLIKDITPENTPIRGVGIGLPGVIDPHSGMIVTAPNLEDWVDTPIAKRIEEEIGAPVVFGNDANLAALGEWHFGAGQGHQNLIYLTISTGIGGGVICDGQLLKGNHGLAGELGHVTILPDGPVCSCGHRGYGAADFFTGTCGTAAALCSWKEGVMETWYHLCTLCSDFDCIYNGT